MNVSLMAPGDDGLVLKEWFSPAELAVLALNGLPGSKRGINLRAADEGWQGRLDLARQPLARRQGGGWEYHVTVLPLEAQRDLVFRRDAARRAGAGEASAVPGAVPGEGATAASWAWFDRQADAIKATARHRLAVIEQVEALVRGGAGKHLAVHEVVAAETRAGRQTSARSIWRWMEAAERRARADRLPALAPHFAGRTVTVDCPQQAWEMLKADYLRLDQPSFQACLRRLRRAAAERGWALPAARTLQRRIEALPVAVVTLARQGAEALKRMYPAQERDRSVFCALEGINMDGHKFDVFVQWPGEETPVRVVMVAIQDLLSGKILAWRVDRTENWDSVRLALADLIEVYGIPSAAWMDNGRNFASKWLTGGTPNRYRFKVREEEPVGILTGLGVEVHFTHPYAGQSKPIERAFRDLCDDIARHPAFAGAWCGNKPEAKPENYGSKAVPLDKFLAVVADGITEHNARHGRRSKVCGGIKSFDQVFSASYAAAPIRRATDEQRRMLLLAAEGVLARKPDGAVRLLGNRYWCEALHEVMGEKVVARFDPDDLHAGVHVYRLDGSYLAFADCVEAAGFSDTQAAREHNRARNAWMRAQRESLAALRKMGVEEVAAMIPAMTPAPAVEAKVVRPLFAAPNPLMARPAPRPVEHDPDLLEAGRTVIAAFAARESEPAESDDDLWRRFVDLRGRDTLTPEEVAWMRSFEGDPIARARLMVENEFGTRAAGTRAAG